MPTTTIPTARFQPIGSFSTAAATSEAVTGFTVTVTATLVGDAFPRAKAQS